MTKSEETCARCKYGLKNWCIKRHSCVDCVMNECDEYADNEIQTCRCVKLLMGEYCDMFEVSDDE